MMFMEGVHFMDGIGQKLLLSFDVANLYLKCIMEITDKPRGKYVRP